MIKIDLKKKQITFSGTKGELLDEFANIALNLFETVGSDGVFDALCRVHDRYISTNDTDDDFIL